MNISDRIRFKTANTVDLFRSFEVACHKMSVHGDAKQVVVSHPFPPALPVVYAALHSVSVCVALQIVQSASLHSLNLVFVVLARKKFSALDSNPWLTCCQLLPLRLWATWKGTVKQNVPPLHTAVSICHPLLSSCSERNSNFNFCCQKLRWWSCALGSPRFDRIALLT